MLLQKAERKKAKIKLGIQGPSGSGKTYSALLISYGLTEDWNKVAVIDTENHSSDLYAHLGGYNVLHLEAPFTPEKYITAIRTCVSEGMEVIIIDSISHEWEGSGGILDTHSQMTGNSFTAWGKLTPRHNAFVQEILQSPVHVLATMRSKQDYILSDKNGKMVPEKVGLKGITREGMDYEFTIVMELDIKHNANTTKDRTGLFIDKPEFKISTATGKRILEWCNEGTDKPTVDILERINACTTINELLNLYQSQSLPDSSTKDAFSKRRVEIVDNKLDNLIQSNSKTNENGRPGTDTLP